MDGAVVVVRAKGSVGNPNVEMYKCGEAGKRGKGARFPVAYRNAESRRSRRAEDKPYAGEVRRNSGFQG